MKEPADDLRADEDEEPPEFDALTAPAELVRGDRTRDDFFDAVLQLDSPATVGEVADLAGHGTDAAREYLDWFERMGIVTQTDTAPATYRLNREFLVWRRSQQICRELQPDEIIDRLSDQRERERELAAQFDAETPENVSLTGFADSADVTVEEAWERVSEWQTVRRRIELLDRAASAAETPPTDRNQSSA